MGAKGKTTIRHQQMEKGNGEKESMTKNEYEIWSRGQSIGWATSDTKSALTTEDPYFLLRASPEAETFSGQRDGSIHRPSLLPEVMQEPC